MSAHEATEELFATPGELSGKERKAKAQGARDRHLCELMGSYGGRATIWDLLTDSHQFQPIAHDDPLLLQRRVGVRDFGLKLLRDLRRACPDQLTLAERESNDRATNRSSARRPE